MYAAVRRYEGVRMEAGELDGAMRRTARALSDAPGFVSFLAIEAEADRLVTVTVFETRETLDEATAGAETQPAPARQAPLPDPDVTTGEIVYQRGL